MWRRKHCKLGGLLVGVHSTGLRRLCEAQYTLGRVLQKYHLYTSQTRVLLGLSTSDLQLTLEWLTAAAGRKEAPKHILGHSSQSERGGSIRVWGLSAISRDGVRSSNFWEALRKVSHCSLLQDKQVEMVWWFFVGGDPKADPGQARGPTSLT